MLNTVSYPGVGNRGSGQPCLIAKGCLPSGQRWLFWGGETGRTSYSILSAYPREWNEAEWSGRRKYRAWRRARKRLAARSERIFVWNGMERSGTGHLLVCLPTSACSILSFPVTERNGTNEAEGEKTERGGALATSWRRIAIGFSSRSVESGMERATCCSLAFFLIIIPCPRQGSGAALPLDSSNSHAPL